MRDPLISSDNSNSTEIQQLTYEEQPIGGSDYLIIICLMFCTYGGIVGLLVAMVSWSTYSGNTLANNNKYYHENMYFNLLSFLVYIVAFGSFWFFGIGKRETYRRQLMEAQLALKENLK